MRLKRILIIGTIFPVLFSIVLFFGILISGEDDDSSNSYSPVYSGMNLSADVLKHQPMVERYARENGISEYVTGASASGKTGIKSFNAELYDYRFSTEWKD